MLPPLLIDILALKYSMNHTIIVSFDISEYLCNFYLNRQLAFIVGQDAIVVDALLVTAREETKKLVHNSLTKKPKLQKNFFFLITGVEDVCLKINLQITKISLKEL